MTYITDELCMQKANWEDIRISANNVAINPITSEPTFSSHPNGFLTYMFPPADTQTVYFNVQFPHSMKKGSAFVPHVHWTATDSTTGVVCWAFAYAVANILQSMTAAITLTANGTTTVTSPHFHYITTFGTQTIANLTISAMMMCSLSRLGNDGADTYTNNAALLEFDIHYQQDVLGSNLETSKNIGG